MDVKIGIKTRLKGQITDPSDFTNWHIFETRVCAEDVQDVVAFYGTEAAATKIGMKFLTEIQAVPRFADIERAWHAKARQRPMNPTRLVQPSIPMSYIKTTRDFFAALRYEKAIPDSCSLRTVEDHLRIGLCLSLVKAMNDNANMSCDGCDLQKAKT